MSFKIFSPGEKESWMNLNLQNHPRLFLSHPPPDYKVQVKKVKHKNSSKINNYKKSIPIKISDTLTVAQNRLKFQL